MAHRPWAPGALAPRAFGANGFGPMGFMGPGLAPGARAGRAFGATGLRAHGPSGGDGRGLDAFELADVAKVMLLRLRNMSRLAEIR